LQKRHALLILLFATLFPTFFAPLASADSGFSNTYGNIGMTEAKCIVQTNDGGYILAGFTNSSGAGGFDAWVIKTDSGGNVVWDKTFGGASDEQAYRIIQTTDGNYVFAGTINYNVWLVKIDSSGNKLWEQTYSASGYANSLFETKDGGYFVCSGYVLLKTDAQGKTIWNKSILNYTSSVVQNNDGSYVLFGNKGWEYVFLIKIDSSGNTQSTQTYQQINCGPNSAIQTSEGGYVFAGSGKGWINSRGGFNPVYSLAKIGANGNLEWNQTYEDIGPQAMSSAKTVIQTNDGGYALAGETGDGPCVLLKTDSNGKIQWSKMYQTQQPKNIAYSLIQTKDGALVIAGFSGNTYFIPGSGVFNIGNAWLLKTDQNGETSTEVTPSPTASSQTSTPNWAFNGAFAIYETTINNSGTITPVQINYTISNVNLQYQTYDLSTNYNGSFANQSSSNIHQSLQQSTGFPAIKASDLALLNKGQKPPNSNLQNAQVNTGVAVTLPGGDFTTDEIIISSNSTMWIDMNSGLIVKMSAGLRFAEGGTTASIFQLLQTNINSETTVSPGTPTNSNSGINVTEILNYPNFIIMGIVIAVIAAVATLAYFARARNKRKNILDAQ
jgi:hypothetical protein